MLEKEIETKVCTYAKDRGVLVYKFTSIAHRSVPDRLFIYDGISFFIEFKRPGAKPTAAQCREHGRIREQKVQVFLIDDVDDGKRMIDFMINIINESRSMGQK